MSKTTNLNYACKSNHTNYTRPSYGVVEGEARRSPGDEANHTIVGCVFPTGIGRCPHAMTIISAHCSGASLHSCITTIINNIIIAAICLLIAQLTSILLLSRHNFVCVRTIIIFIIHVYNIAKG